jgi:SAM-dependent methyltransferase
LPTHLQFRKRKVAGFESTRLFNTFSWSIKVITCSVCGGTTFAESAVLWDKLVADWQLAPHERTYIDRQQGTHCTSCGANFRSIALADAIRTAAGTTLTLEEFVKTTEAKKLAVLEINEAGSLSPFLRQLSGHVLAAYPAVDIHALPYSDDVFDLVVHSDTLEHVAHPIRALEECRRVLLPGATVCFTIPTVVERLSRSRAGLSKSYHGAPETGADDYLVHTEFGADMWTYVLRAGFSALSINAVEYPAALALSARKSGPATPISPYPKQVASASGSQKPARIVSVHFPKAAGSSLHIQLVKLLGEKVSLDYTHDPLTSAGFETAGFPIGKTIVHGHFRAQRYASEKAYWMTFLRHPVDNLISIYFYWKTLPEPGHALHGRFLREQPSILEFAMYPGITRLMSETYFGDFDMSRFNFVGFYENRDTDVPRLAEDLGLPLVAGVHENRTNESIERVKLEADASVRQRLSDLLVADIAFYQDLRRRYGAVTSK